MGVQPQHGGRILLSLSTLDKHAAHYALTLWTADAQWSGQASVALEGGQIELSGLPAEAAEWLLELTRAILRTTWRNHKIDGWPPRIQRWRPIPTEGI